MWLDRENGHDPVVCRQWYRRWKSIEDLEGDQGILCFYRRSKDFITNLNNMLIGYRKDVLLDVGTSHQQFEHNLVGQRIGLADALGAKKMY